MNYVVFISISTVLTFVAGIPVAKKDSYNFPYYTREDWGGVPPTNVQDLISPVPYVVIHHTYIPGACYNNEQCSRSMMSMQNYHNSLGWGDIGYNFCIGSDGGAYEGRGWETRGVHANVANSYSIGICLIGDWRETLPPSEQLETTKALIEAGVQRGIISPNYKLIAHKQVSSTECPGTALFNEISAWKHFAPEGFVTPTHTNKKE